MCGITGIVRAGNLQDGRLIKAMTDVLRHRGPDDEGYLLFDSKSRECEERGGKDTPAELGLRPIEGGSSKTFDSVFGFRRLSILDLSPSGHQPMHYDGGNLWVVFNGEIYNYIELREELKSKGYAFRTSTDTEVLLASYREWGEACLEKFNGMWAFVIYDRRRNVLFGSRDRFGVKPLYYTIGDSGFAFASEIKALLQLPSASRRINEKVLFNFLLLDFVEQGEETFFSGIRKVPHSHYFIYDIAGNYLRFERYYRLRYSEEAGVFSERKSEEYEKTIRELLFEAVRLRLRSDVLVGSCLSGGIDSSAIVTIINSIPGDSFLTKAEGRHKVFTASYPGENVDESHFAMKVVERTATEWHRVLPRYDELWNDLQDLIYSQEEPFSSTSIYAQYRVMKMIGEAGVKVVLDGQGGDELFAGYPGYYGVFFSSLLMEFRPGTLLSELFSFGNAPLTARLALAESLKSLFLRFASNRLISPTVLRLKPSITEFLNRDFLEEYRDEIAKCYRERWQSKNLNQYLVHVMEDFGLQELLKYEDRNSMRFSIEARTPFADDVNLIDYVFRIPWVYKIHDGWSKYLLRNAVSDLLPHEISRRKSKIGFATPEARWLSELSERFGEFLGHSDEYIDTGALRRAIAGDGRPEVFMGDIWRFLNVMIWKSMFGHSG